MKDLLDYDVLIVTTAGDYKRTQATHQRFVDFLPGSNIILVSGEDVKEIIAEDSLEEIVFCDENTILRFEDVEAVVQEHLADALNGNKVPRGAVGWYYQQFLKLEYARKCEKTYYMTWDGDTVPCKEFSMFSEDGKPYFDMKYEYFSEYFETMQRLLPETYKVMERSFISEHMIFRCDIVREMLDVIEANTLIKGTTWWEKIIKCIPVELYDQGVFSEFETYGTYVSINHTSEYKLRSWNSFRYAAYFLHPETMIDRDWEWLAKDFYALSFEKKMQVRSDYENIFNNPRYQEKLSARQVLELCQEEMTEGYKEVWDE